MGKAARLGAASPSTPRGPLPKETAFGLLQAGPDPRHPQPAPDLPTIDERLSDLLAKDAREEIAQYRWEVPLLVGGVYSYLDRSAAKLIFSAALTDAMAVVRHVDELDGRSAALRARTLFEHLLNLCDVIESPTNTGKRYLDHRWVVQALRAKRRDHLQVLAKGEARRETRRLDALAKKARRPLRKAVEAYGKGYPIGWAAGSVKTRADAYGLKDDYDGYALLSAAIHGSSGSLDGVVRRIHGEVVHRTGHDLELSATAWWEGLAWFYQLVDRIQRRWPNWAAEQIRQATANLLWLWPQVRTVLHEQDEKIWPDTPPPPPSVGVVIYPTRVRWFYYRPVDDVVIPVDPPDPLPGDLSARIEAIRHLVSSFEEGVYAQRSPLIPLPGVHLPPRAGAGFMPASGLHPSSEDQWRRFVRALCKKEES